MRARPSWRLIAARPPAPLIPARLVRMAATSPTTENLAELDAAERVAAETSAQASADGALRGLELLRRLKAVYATSGACGARIHSQTSVHVQRDAGVEFVLRVLPSLKSKPQGGAAAAAAGGDAKPKAPPPANPFLPYDPRLFVSNLSPTHCLLLNKFDVVPLHSLVVTREFRAQTEPLDASDLSATWAAMAALAAAGGGDSSSSSSSEEAGALAFYNCGEHSGRSQPHKHVQVVPLPFREDGDERGAPIAALVRAALAEEEERNKRRNQGDSSTPLIAELCSLPFRAYATPAPSLLGDDGSNAAAAFAALEKALDAMVSRCAADCAPSSDAVSYNLLLTAGWAVAVPRRSERDRPSEQQQEGGGVSAAINALGFAGTLLCKSDAELAHVRNKGPFNVLADAGWPW